MEKINKIIHYCWFGGNDLSPLALRCMESWRLFMPDYQVKRWDESSIDLRDPFVRVCVKEKKWAFLSDRVRFDALYKEGGIYLDIDVEVVKSLDELSSLSFYAGRECVDYINAAVVGAAPGNPLCKQLAQIVEASVLSGGAFVAVPKLITPVLAEFEGAPGGGTCIFPADYFYPYNPYDKSRPVRQLMAADITENTYTIHHWQKGWTGGKKRDSVFRKLFGRLGRPV